jgi:hypothetical protein
MVFGNENVTIPDGIVTNEFLIRPLLATDIKLDVEVAPMQYPVTPDGRYFVVRGRLWRCTNPALAEDERRRLTSELMRHRAAVGRARRAGNAEAEQDARRKIHEAKVALGERGPVWWADDAPDYNRYLAKNTPYRSWYESLTEQKDV